jgi:peroxiredoxin Q/BCP
MQGLTGLAIALAAAAACGLAGCENSSLIQEEAASSRSQIINSPAPDFMLRDQNGQEVTLSKLRGQWVVLYFYPKDDTPGCTCEATEFSKLIGQFKGMNATVYGVSADSIPTHKIFVEKYNLGIGLLSDPEHRAMRSYGAWVESAIGEKSYERVIRTTVILDPQGVIRYHWPEVIPKGHAERVGKKLVELQARDKAPAK